MKKLFIFLNVLLTSCVGWLIYTHVSHTPAPPDKVLDETPEKHSINRIGIFDKETGSKPGNLSYIYENNIFIPNRGEVADAASADGSKAMKKYTGSFELAGISKMGDLHGAIITSGSKSSRSSLRAKFYRVDEQIATTNYRLVEVSPQTGSVVISDGSSRSVLELDRDDSGSKSRRTSEVRKQEIASKKAEMDFNKTKVKTTVTPPADRPGVAPPTPSKKKTPEEIAEIRKKILARMAEQKKKNNSSNKKKSSSNKRR